MSQSDWERGYGAGFMAGLDAQRANLERDDSRLMVDFMRGKSIEDPLFPRKAKRKPRKLSAWQKFVKTNSKKPRFKYKTGKRKGMVNMKALAAAWKRKKKR